MPITQDELIEAGIQQGLLDHARVDELRIEARRRREQLVETVTRRGRFPVAALYRAFAEQRGLGFIDLLKSPLEKDLFSSISETLMRRRLIVPVSRNNNEVLIATADPDDQPTLDSVQRMLGQSIQVSIADPESILQAIEIASRKQSGTAVSIAAAEVDPVEALQRIMSQAFLRRASDIHLEPLPAGLQVRFRIDGRLVTFLAGLDSATATSILSRVKVLAGLNIAEQRAPQDGRFSYSPDETDDLEIDVRVATIPTRWGERATLRLLGTATDDLTLANLGMPPACLKKFHEAIRRPHGIILLTGPTGSGKSTTLYAALREIQQPHLNLMTVENPIEYLMPGISQIQIGGSDKVTFASALRSLLRHDPDILMVGEIRDHETVDIALKAAMTGHLLFSTLHTNSACGAITRLVDIGCEPYLVGATLSAVIAQRLVRRLCQHCRLKHETTADEASLLNVTPGTEIYKPGECAHCMGSGYFGRVGLFEPLWIDDQLRQMISSGATQSQIEAYAAKSLVTIRTDGTQKVLAGVTSLDEVLTVTIEGV